MNGGGHALLKGFSRPKFSLFLKHIGGKEAISIILDIIVLFYIGKTMRHLTTRVREHGSSPSAVYDHLQSCTKCNKDYSCSNNFSILDRGNSDFEITITEALCIKSLKPYFNKQLSTHGSSYHLNIF